MATADIAHDNLSGARAPHPWTNLGRMSGAVGVVLLLSSPLTWLLTRHMGPMVWAKVLIGMGLIAVYLATNADFFARLAGSRSTGLLAMSSATVALTFAMVVAANYAAFKSGKEWDLTRGGIYTLSPQTQQLVGGLERPVKVLAFVANTEPTYAQTREVLGRYARLGDKLTYELLSPQARPDLVQRYHITEGGPRLVVLGEAGAGGGEAEARAKDVSEQELTYAIAQVTRQSSKTIYVVQGHREPSPKDREAAEGLGRLDEALVAEGFRVEELDFSRLPGASVGGAVSLADPQAAAEGARLTVPHDAAAVLVLGAQRPLAGPEVGALKTYLDGGGRLVVGLEPKVDTGLGPLAADMGVEVMDDLIVDTNPMSQLFGLGPAAPMLQPAPDGHPITEKMGGGMVMSTARSLRVAPGTSTAQALAQTGMTAWGETRLGADGTASRDAFDHPAPLATAVAAWRALPGEGEGEAKEARLVAFGDADWLNNKHLDMLGNRDLALNAILWAVEDADRITIRPRGRPGTQLFLSAAELGRLKFFSIDILPTLLVACGLGIVLVRRQR